MDDNHPQSTSLRSGELARLAGVSTDTLRHYERLGLLARPGRAANGYRQYPASALDRVRLVRSALTVRFTLAELAALLGTRDLGGIPCRQVRELTARKLGELEERLQRIQRMRDVLCRLLDRWDARLSRTEPGERAWLLETLLEGEAARDLLPEPFALKRKRTQED